MQVTILTSFKKGYQSYEAGEVRSIPDEDAIVFARRGWVLVDGITPDAQTGGTLTLDIHKARMGTTSKGL